MKVLLILQQMISYREKIRQINSEPHETEYLAYSDNFLTPRIAHASFYMILYAVPALDCVNLRGDCVGSMRCSLKLPLVTRCCSPTLISITPDLLLLLLQLLALQLSHRDRILHQNGSPSGAECIPGLFSK